MSLPPLPKRVMIGALALLAAGLAPLWGAPPPMQPVREIRVAAAALWAPYATRDASGRGSGPAFDLIRLILEPAGVRVVVDETKPWRRHVADLQDGRLDIILTAYRVEPFGVYTEAYASDEVRVFVAPGKEFPFRRLEDLSGKIGAQPLGASYDVTFRERAPGLPFVMRQNADPKVCFNMVLEGKADYYVSAYYDVVQKLLDAGLKGKLVALDKPVYVEDVVMVVSRESAALDMLPLINDGIRRAKADGTVARLIRAQGTASSR